MSGRFASKGSMVQEGLVESEAQVEFSLLAAERARKGEQVRMRLRIGRKVDRAPIPVVEVVFSC